MVNPMQSGQNPKRVLIVDDSPTIRRLIRSRLLYDNRIAVVGEASNAVEARQLIRELAPDIITLDIEMPGMNGLEFLRKLMQVHPMPVVMVSSETQEGSVAALEALSLGAVDCVGKPRAGELSTAFTNLGELLYCASSIKIRYPKRSIQYRAPEEFKWNGKRIVIGSSTGGVDALEVIMSGLPENCPPVLITQHMPETFLANFAKRLAGRFAPKILLAEDGAPIVQGTVYLAPGGASHLTLDGSEQNPVCRLLYAERCGGYRPSVEVLFRSAAPYAARLVAVMLTGMGRDGADAMRVLRSRGADCVAQDEATSAVYGMPRAALEVGAVDRGTPVAEIAGKVLALCDGDRLY